MNAREWLLAKTRQPKQPPPPGTLDRLTAERLRRISDHTEPLGCTCAIIYSRCHCKTTIIQAEINEEEAAS